MDNHSQDYTDMDKHPLNCADMDNHPQDYTGMNNYSQSYTDADVDKHFQRYTGMDKHPKDYVNNGKQFEGSYASTRMNSENESSVEVYDEDPRRDEDFDLIIQEFSVNIHPPVAFEKECLRNWFYKMKSDLIVKAIYIAVGNDRRTLNYIIGILKNWNEDGITTLEEYEENCNNRFNNRRIESDYESNIEYKILDTEPYENEWGFC